MDNHESSAPGGGLSRRAVLQTATAAAGIAISAPAALAEPSPAPSFGAPLAELDLRSGICLKFRAHPPGWSGSA